MITPGLGGCPDCGLRVLFALAATGDLIPLDEGQDGPVAVRWDVTDTPRVRPVEPGYRPREGEHRFRLHVRSCPALAPVVAITAAPSLRPRQPVPGGRQARAR